MSRITIKTTEKFYVPMPAEPRGTTFVAIGPMCWGGGLSRDDARKNMKREASYSGTYTMYRIDGEFIMVDGMGNVRYNGAINAVEKGTIKVS